MTGLPAPAPGQVIQLNDATIKLLQKSIRADQLNIAKIVAANSNRSVRQIQSAMNAQVFLAPDQMLKWELVHGIADIAYPAGASLLTIQ